MRCAWVPAGYVVVAGRFWPHAASTSEPQTKDKTTGSLREWRGARMEPPARANNTRSAATAAIALNQGLSKDWPSNGEQLQILALNAMKRVTQHQVKICTR